MHNLGHTRSSHQPNHLLLTPDTFVRTTLPGMKDCAAIVHCGPAMGARFTEYTAEFEAGGEMVGNIARAAFYFCDGRRRQIGREPDQQSELGARGYAYVPAGTDAPDYGRREEPRGRD